MQHLRVICPPELTEEVLGGLRAQPGATHLVALRGVAVDPAGDVVEADVARESVDVVLAELTGLRLDHVGAITVEDLGTTLSDAADRAERAAPGLGVDAVVWDELLARTDEDARLTGTFQAFLVIACLLAAIGVITDSAVTVVGAMVVGPEFGPLAAIAVGVVLRRMDLVRRAAFALVVGFPVAMLITGIGTLLLKAVGLVDATRISDAESVEFVYQVSPFSLIVALLAGAAGMLAITSAKSAALVGVFISVTTVPAAGYVVVAAVVGEWGRSMASLGQLLLNLVGIVLAAIIVLVVRRKAWTLSAANRPLSAG